MHLHTAEQIQTAVSQSDHPYNYLAGCLTRGWSAFYLGNVAPDVQNLNGMAREATHFYHIPQPGDLPAYDEMLAQHPLLAWSEKMSAEQALFVAGYRAHLLLDQIWWRDVAAPHFFYSELFSDLPQRRLAHFVLLAYLDAKALAALPATAGETLAQATPDEWLPFVSDGDLRRWRDMIVDQLLPGALPQTTAVYAARLGLPPDRLAQNLQDEGWMAANLFEKVPLAGIENSLQTAVSASITLIRDYLPSPN
jgi:hypothetical protein